MHTVLEAVLTKTQSSFQSGINIDPIEEIEPKVGGGCSSWVGTLLQDHFNIKF